MADGARYRQKARDFEQRENWKRAIEAYELAIESDEVSGRDVDLALYNRIGDLYRRVGDVHKAVEYYEMAVDGHLAAGFYNNAIALCNKILRNKPNRHSAYLKLGKIGAAKGFLSDARRHFLEYAERMQKANKLDEAFSALIEFAGLSPDPEVRLLIADQLLEHDRNDMAVDQLRLAWRDLSDAGRDADAADIRDRILDMAPDRDPEVDPPEASEYTGLDAEGILDLPELLPYGEPEPRERREVEPETVEESGLEVVGREPLEESGLEIVDREAELESPEHESLEIDASGVETFEAEPVDIEGVDLEALEVQELEPEPEGDALDVEPTTISDAGVAIEPVVEAPRDSEGLDILPTALESEEPDEAEATTLFEPEAVAEKDVGEAVEVEMTVEGWGEPDEAVVSPDEPTVAAVEEVEATPADRAAELEGRMGIEGREPELLVDLAEALLEMGETATATGRLEEALASFEARGQAHEAGRVLDELIRLNVNDLRAYQKRVELALKAGDRGGLIEAYLGLADCLDRTDAGNKAKIVYGRVLELDPENPRAVAALEMFVEEAEPEPAHQAQAAPGSSEYVDLGSLVAEEESDKKSTRFVVSAGDPQSESDVDFSRMLDQFKSKVADAIEKEDASSHYDLGLAFKDMGLLDEAIAEFQIAARGHAYRLRAIEMLGACFLEKGDHRIALKVLSRALQVPGYADEDLIGIYYSMGRAYESVGEAGTALEWYERVLGCDVHFMDTSRRVSSLRQ
ncbi:MAG: hypothetical protein AMS21_10950 [Gemmatimonas sp. SG8_38_2]|nr:MAG: hypothetical protein AMS21_10950 [Gemmatimonas sp. SG8_38_2]